VPRAARGLRLRAARAEDAEALAGFSCSTGPWFEEEVQHHIRHDALARADEPDDDYRLVLFEQDAELWAVGAHRLEWLVLRDGSHVPLTHLAALALSIDHQGSVASDGRRYADIALSGLLDDALRHRRERMVFALVALENVRSQRLCRRHGLVFESRADARRLRMTGRFTAPGRGGRAGR
jgi:RimJ/RimL family protein N-acetyltransferase